MSHDTDFMSVQTYLYIFYLTSVQWTARTIMQIGNYVFTCYLYFSLAAISFRDAARAKAHIFVNHLSSYLTTSVKKSDLSTGSSVSDVKLIDLLKR